MQVLLMKDVDGLGQAGDIKNVATGYAQNFLFPRKLAVPATEGALKQAKALRESAERRRQTKTSQAKELAARLDGQVVTFPVRAGEGDRLYGSITNHDIADALSKLIGTEVEHHYVVLEHPVKTLGDHPVSVRLGSGAVATVTVRVEREAV